MPTLRVGSNGVCVRDSACHTSKVTDREQASDPSLKRTSDIYAKYCLIWTSEKTSDIDFTRFHRRMRERKSSHVKKSPPCISGKMSSALIGPKHQSMTTSAEKWILRRIGPVPKLLNAVEPRPSTPFVQHLERLQSKPVGPQSAIVGCYSQLFSMIDGLRETTYFIKPQAFQGHCDERISAQHVSSLGCKFANLAGPRIGITAF